MKRRDAAALLDLDRDVLARAPTRDSAAHRHGVGALRFLHADLDGDSRRVGGGGRRDRECEQRRKRHPHPEARLPHRTVTGALTLGREQRPTWFAVRTSRTVVGRARRSFRSAPDDSGIAPRSRAIVRSATQRFPRRRWSIAWPNGALPRTTIRRWPRRSTSSRIEGRTRTTAAVLELPRQRARNFVVVSTFAVVVHAPSDVVLIVATCIQTP